MYKVMSLVFFAIFLSACQSTPSISECASIDWQQQGLTDAKVGTDVLYFQEYVKSCKEQSHTPDKEAYYSGFQDGLVIYCTQENGLERGKKGGQFYKACKEYPDYIVGYAKGAEIHIEERERREVEKLTRPTTRADTGGVAGGSSPTQ